MLVVPLKNPVNSMDFNGGIIDRGAVSKPSSSASNFMSSRNSSAILPGSLFKK